MKDFTRHYQRPADWTEGISRPEKCATTAEISLRFPTQWRCRGGGWGGGVTLSALPDDLGDRQQIIAS